MERSTEDGPWTRGGFLYSSQNWMDSISDTPLTSAEDQMLCDVNSGTGYLINAWSSRKVCQHKSKAVYYRGIPKVTPSPPPSSGKKWLPESNVNFFPFLLNPESNGPSVRSGLLKKSLKEKVFSVVNSGSCEQPDCRTEQWLEELSVLFLFISNWVFLETMI